SQDNKLLHELDTDNPWGTDLFITSWRKLDVYSLDFGWGRPVKFRFDKAWTFEGMCIIMDAEPTRDGGGGTDVYLCLTKDQMSDFINLHEGFMNGLKEENEDWEM